MKPRYWMIDPELKAIIHRVDQDEHGETWGNGYRGLAVLLWLIVIIPAIVILLITVLK